MIKIFKKAVQRGASDIHIKPGAPIRARIGNELVPLAERRLSPEQTRKVALKLIPREEDRERIEELRDYDCSWGAPGVGRFRVNILRQRGSLMVVMRVIPFEIPSFKELDLPPILADIAHEERGMVLVTGVTGSGKSTTLAAMLGHLNRTARKHLITLEQPIEFLYRDNECSITQREIGTDTESFAVGLRAALREDPDVVLVGEMRDSTTIGTAMKAAETGHLVLSTLHTRNAVQTVSRVIATFPPDEQPMVRMRLAENLSAVVSQRLVPRREGGRIAACEIMHVTETMRDAIRDPSLTAGIHELIAEGRDHYGSQTFDQHLMDLVEDETVAFDVAKAASSNPSDFELHMRTLA